ncbi:DUF1772 domain-containing protein [Thalassotalea sp. 1_MG-2023]|uniref:DUF1772 domain-containing protein n=1 Tax=Thalassotalea sp. 1_MG-2023 TaxID=3062680 RepID=UPI0026E383B8|nr:DUF1772 domain-containing protein [Thalassotalea sp. 1_MG-2023]MDO6426972.1 DUF1772 domain-containing protein [Thalassotalea sp. 1_MG-2023]
MFIIEIIAILSCVIFAGIAIYINVVEHPARLACGTELAMTVFGPSYRRAAVLQASLAIIATIMGIVLGVNSGNTLWFVGALFIFLVVPFTFIAIMPTNNQLLDANNSLTQSENDVLLKKWGRLHGMRSALSSVAAILYVLLSVNN